MYIYMLPGLLEGLRIVNCRVRGLPNVSAEVGKKHLGNGNYINGPQEVNVSSRQLYLGLRGGARRGGSSLLYLHISMPIYIYIYQFQYLYKEVSLHK